MNEPSVSDLEEGTMTKTAIHILENGQHAYHRDIHNMYGLMMAKATFDGLI